MRLIRSVTIVITFNGTNLITVLVNGEEREVDLSARDGQNPVRSRRPDSSPLPNQACRAARSRQAV